MTEGTMSARLTAGQRLALSGAILMALVLAVYGALGSYTTIATTAARLGVPFPELVPIGIDGGLVGVVTLDLVLAWTGHRLGWLRQLARLLTVGTVAANVSAGWPDPIAVGLHAAAPLMLLAMVEAGRAVLLRRAGLASGIARDRIPIGRWILSPWRTWLLWRRMILWHITHYHDALNIEARIRRARALLRIRFGPGWKRTAPADLVWMLGVAPFAADACARVDTLIKQDNTTRVTTLSTDDDHTPSDLETGEDADVDQLDEAMRLNEQHWAARNRPVSAETLRKHLHIGAARARELTTAVRSMDKAAVKHKPTLLPADSR